MFKHTATGLSVVLTSLTLVLAAPAHAAETPSAPLICDNGTTVQVTGFGRGIPLKLVGSTSNYVIKYASAGGQVLLDLPITGNKDAITCTTTSPTSGTTYTFRGFFTPAAS